MGMQKERPDPYFLLSGVRELATLRQRAH